MTRRVLAAIAILLVAAALGVVFWPETLGLQRQIGVAQVLAFRSAAAVAGVLIAAIVLVVVLAARRARRARRVASILLAVVLVFAGAEGAVQASRGWASSSTSASGDITILSWNTRGGPPDAGEIARLALAEKADIVSLPETRAATAVAVAEIMGAAGHPMWVHNRFFDTVAAARTTSLLISASLGRYHLDTSAGSTRVIPSGVFRPNDGTGPVIVAAHPVSPIPGQMNTWRQGVAWVAAQCSGPNVIVAGDLNSTIDHWAGLGKGGGDLGECRDGAKATGAAAVGSWPTNLPWQLGTPIDHVLAGSGWTFTSFRVITTEDAAGSDHRPVVAHLHPTG